MRLTYRAGPVMQRHGRLLHTILFCHHQICVRAQIRLLRIFGEGCLQDVPRYARDTGPFIAMALEEFEAVDLTFGHAGVGL